MLLFSKSRFRCFSHSWAAPTAVILCAAMPQKHSSLTACCKRAGCSSAWFNDRVLPSRQSAVRFHFSAPPFGIFPQKPLLARTGPKPTVTGIDCSCYFSASSRYNDNKVVITPLSSPFLLSHSRNCRGVSVCGPNRDHPYSPAEAPGTTSGGRKCWNCAREVTSMFICSQCNTIQPPHEFVSLEQEESDRQVSVEAIAKTSQSETKQPTSNHAENISEAPLLLNYFHIFQVEPKFDIDLQAVKKEYRRILAELHPDKFSGSSEKEQEYSHRISTLVNRALKTLQSPYLRGRYLLKVKAFKVQASDDSYSANSQQFLQLVLEWNEILVELPPGDSQGLGTLREKLSNARQDLMGNISKYFESGNLVQVDDCLAQLKYLDNISEKLKFQFD